MQRRLFRSRSHDLLPGEQRCARDAATPLRQRRIDHPHPGSRNDARRHHQRPRRQSRIEPACEAKTHECARTFRDQRFRRCPGPRGQTAAGAHCGRQAAGYGGFGAQAGDYA